MRKSRPDDENIMTRKLELFARLSSEDKAVLDGVWHRRSQTLLAQRDIARQGEAMHRINLMKAGWACRYKTLPDGRRQILSFFLPGDLCDLNIFILKRMDHSIMALTDVRYVTLGPDDLENLTVGHPRILQGLWWETLVNIAIQREWTLNLGQRTAAERLAHLLCELFSRLRTVGMTQGTRCALPLTQAELADTLGLSTVHINRTIRSLRDRELIHITGRELEILDFDGLCQVAMFDDAYLHLDHEGARFDSNEN